MALYLRWAAWCLKHRIATTLAAAGVLLRLVRAGAAAADRLRPARRPVADAGLPVAAAGQHLRADAARGRAGARDRREESAREDGLHGDRRRRGRLRPVRAARRGRGAQGDADHQPDAARGSRRRQQAGRRAPAARGARRHCPACASRSASAARPRSTSWCWPARTAGPARRTRAPRRARAAHHSRHRQRDDHGQPGAAGARRAARLRRAADLGVTSAAIADTLRIATAGDYDQRLAKLNLSQRQVPIVVKLPPDGAPGPRPARAADRARQERPGDARQRGAPWPSRAGRPRSTATTACATSTSRSNSTSSRSARSRNRRWRCRACRTCRRASARPRSAMPRR